METAAEDFVRTLAASYGSALQAYALRALGDRSAAEEVVQDVFVRAWRHADRFDPSRGELGTWLFAIARNLVIDRHRSRGRDRSVAVEGIDSVEPEELDRALEAWQVAEALRRLTPAHRSALVETYFMGRSTAEAAQALGVPPGTVKSRVYYGLRALRVALEEAGVVG